MHLEYNLQSRSTVREKLQQKHPAAPLESKSRLYGSGLDELLPAPLPYCVPGRDAAFLPGEVHLLLFEWLTDYV